MQILLTVKLVGFYDISVLYLLLLFKKAVVFNYKIMFYVLERNVFFAAFKIAQFYRFLKFTIQSYKLSFSLSDCNGTRTYIHLIRKRTLNHLAKLAKWLYCIVSTYLYGAYDCMYFNYNGVIIFLLNLWPICQKLSIKFQTILKT